MAKARGDIYHVDKDTRHVPDGALTTISTFDDWKMAKAAFDAATPAENEILWFWRQNGNGTGVVTINCKEGPEVRLGAKA